MSGRMSAADNKGKPKIVLAHKDRGARDTLARDLTQKGYAVRATDRFDTLWKWVRAGEGDLVLLDVDIVDPARNGFELLKQIRQGYPQLPTVVLSGENTVLTSLLAARFGAFDYFPIPFSFAQLAASIARALKQPEPEPQQQTSRTALPLTGSSAPMQAVYRLIARAAQSDLPVLLSGETGTGKSRVAKILHDYGNRSDSTCAVLRLPAGLDEFENTLAETCDRTVGGTLVVDEISALTETQQNRLISVFSDYEDQPGAPRLIATTRSLVTAQGQVQGVCDELLYRLNTLHITLPPLRDRDKDCVELARVFTAQADKPQKRLSAQAEQSLSGRAWPGNVRELRNVMQRAVLMARSTVIEADDILPVGQSPGASDDEELEGTFARALAHFFSDTEVSNMPVDLYAHALSALERPLLKRVMAMAAGNQLMAAKLLGINRNTLHKKLVSHKILPQKDQD